MQLAQATSCTPPLADRIRLPRLHRTPLATTTGELRLPLLDEPDTEVRLPLSPGGELSPAAAPGAQKQHCGSRWKLARNVPWGAAERAVLGSVRLQFAADGLEPLCAQIVLVDQVAEPPNVAPHHARGVVGVDL